MATKTIAANQVPKWKRLENESVREKKKLENVRGMLASTQLV
jgi:hypothetical protein